MTSSLLFFWGWVISLFGNNLAWTWLGDSVPAWAISSVVFLLAFGGSLALTSACVRPMGRLFDTHTVRGGDALVGRTCVVRTGRVDEHFGQAELLNSQILIHVRCDHENKLKKGSEALVIDYHKAKDVYGVEPMRIVLGEPSEDAFKGLVKVPAAEEPSAEAPVPAAEPAEVKA